MKSILLTLCIFLSFTQANASELFLQKVIYGHDDRVEVDDYFDARFRDFSNSVAGRVHTFNFTPMNYIAQTDSYFVIADTLSEAQNICPSERFSQQKMFTDCSGFLVGEDILVTAGHCMTNEYDCMAHKWVFGFKKDVEQIPADNIYGCSEIIEQKFKYSLLGTLLADNDEDFAVIKLDRKVTDATPLEFRTKGKIKAREKVIVIGHPSGLPMKIAGNAKVAKTLGNSFRTELDTYAGNSGSPVFNQKTGLVEGVLIQGAKDYVSVGECKVSNLEKGKKERVFKITKVDSIQKMKANGEL